MCRCSDKSGLCLHLHRGRKVALDGRLAGAAVEKKAVLVR